ncbi:MAG: domain S-box protein [Schlesneria sp.]|nr:domain S-box protein [Schlesneria sp.]
MYVLARSFNPRSTAIFGLILSVLIVNCVVVYRSTTSQHQIQVSIARSQEALLQVETVFSELKDAESNARAFVITGDQAFLTAYQRASANVPALTEKLNDSTDRSTHSQRFKEFSRRALTRVALLQSIVEARQDEGMEAGRRLIASGSGREEMERVRAVLNEIRVEENKRFVERTEAAEKKRVAALTANVTAVSMAVMVTAAAWFFIERELEKRRYAEVAAKEERQNLLMTLTSIGDAVIVTDAAARVTLVNSVAKQLLGQSGELIGRSLADVFPVVHRATKVAATASLAKALQTGEVVASVDDLILLRPDATEIPIEHSAAPIRDESGATTGIVLVFRDCTQRRELQRAAKEREHRFRRMFETPLIGIAVGNGAGFLEEANDAYLDLIGYQRGELGESSLSWGGVPAGQSPLNESAQVELSETGICKPFERTYRNSTGQEVPVLVSAARLSDQQDRIVVYVMDLTQSRRTEAAYRESESRFRVLSECMPQKVWTARPDGQLDYLNQTLIAYAGRPKEELTGWGWLDVIHPDDVEPHLKGWRQSVASGEMFEIEVRLRKESGEYRWHLTRALPIYASDTQVVTWLGTNTDIHDQKLAEESLREEHRRKDQFLAVLAHELRNPLAPLSNAVQVFSSMRLDPSKASDLLAIMQRQIRQMTRLIDDLLDLARITQGRILLRRDWTSAKSIVSVAIEAVQPMVNERQHQLTVKQPDEDIWLNADAARLAQSLTNLLHNAAKYTSPQGRIDLIVEKENSCVLFRVRDNGAGIPANMVNRVFDLFMQVEQTLDRSHGGLGIGLTLVRTLIELHGGSVFAQSSGTGQGSEFTIKLPLSAEPSTPATKTPAKPVESAPLPELNVLVVDDIQASAKTLVLMLKAVGQKADAIFDGRSAITKISDGNFDIVFLDIAMPGMDGLEVARELRQNPRLQSLTLVALTGFGQEEDRQRSIQAGFTEHLVKPTSLELLTAVISRVAARK